MNKEYCADIIVVDDNPANLTFLSEMLRRSGYLVRAARSGKLALAAARMAPPDLFLLDVNMPEMNGYELCRHVREDPRHADTPVIFVSASDEPFDKVMAFSVGGVDYVTKPFQYEVVVARIETHLRLNRQRKEIERMRQQERQYFQSLSEMKDQVVQMATHDLRNPLTAIRLHVSLLSSRLQDDEKVQRGLQQISRQADNMLDIITSMLDLAKLETGLDIQQEPIEVNYFFADIVERFAVQAQKKSISLALEPLDHKFVLQLDRIHCNRVFENLLANAIKYTEPDGAVTVALNHNNRTFSVSVRDTGIGIPASALPNIFERFYRVDDRRHATETGTGLGLAIVKTIVEQHGGQIMVESTEGQGTEFTVSMPTNTLQKVANV